MPQRFFLLPSVQLSFTGLSFEAELISNKTSKRKYDMLAARIYFYLLFSVKKNEYLGSSFCSLQNINQIYCTCKVRRQCV